MGYDRGDSFPFDFEPNGFPFGLKSKGNLSPRSYPIQCERNWKYSFLSVHKTEHMENYITDKSPKSMKYDNSHNPLLEETVAPKSDVTNLWSYATSQVT